MFCFAPLIMAGYLFTVQTSWHHSENVSAPYLEVQTCESGMGAHVKASAAGLYGAGIHYGFTHEFNEKWRITFQPKGGASYADHPIHELPLRTQFEVGAGVLVGYEQFRMGIEYWHLSNAGLRDPNIGVDMIGLTTGWTF